MSEVKTNIASGVTNNTSGLPLKAGNTVETLAPKDVLEVKDANKLPAKVDAPKAKETPKAEAPKANTTETESVSVSEMHRLNAEWAAKPVSRVEFQELADAVQDLADRLTKHNTRAPFKI